jgi:hypothetical protein
MGVVSVLKHSRQVHLVIVLILLVTNEASQWPKRLDGSQTNFISTLTREKQVPAKIDRKRLWSDHINTYRQKTSPSKN